MGAFAPSGSIGSDFGTTQRCYDVDGLTEVAKEQGGISTPIPALDPVPGTNVDLDREVIGRRGEVVECHDALRSRIERKLHI